MKKYSGFEFDSGVNRLLMGLDFMDGKSDVTQHEVDPEDPYKAPHPGYHTRPVETGGCTKYYTLYVPKRFPPFGDGVLLFVPGGNKAETYMKENGIDRLCEETDTAVIGLERPEGSWTDWDLNEALAYSRAVYCAQNVRDLCGINEGGYSVAGLKDGSYTGGIFALLYASALSAVALTDVPPMDPDLLQQILEMPADGNPLKTKAEVPISAWITGSNPQLRDIFRKCSHAGEKLLAESYELYLQKEETYDDRVNKQAVAQVRYTGQSDTISLKQLFCFMKSFKRQPGIGDKFYRATQTEEALCVQHFEEKLDGLLRQWYVYTPQEYDRCPDKKYPVVVGLHGVTSTGLDFQRISEWNRLAEAKGIIMVYPFGYMRRFGPVMAPTVAWNYQEDDIRYIHYLTEFVRKNYRVDESRIYLTGHSNGSAMTQTILRCDPEIFAAYAPIGLTEGELTDCEMMPALPHSTKRPIWFMKGEFDIGCGGSLEDGTVNANMLRHWCDLNGCRFEEGRCYTNPPYETTTWYDKDHIPYVRFTSVKGMYHAFNPEMSRLIWDYFCHFRMKPDHTVEYLG